MKRKLLLTISICVGIAMSQAQISRNISSVDMSGKISQKETSMKISKASPMQKEAKLVSAYDLTSINKEDNIIKASKAPAALPVALYKRPAGAYIPSLIGNSNPDFLGYSYSHPSFYGSAFSIPWTFRNLTTGATAYSWDWGSSLKYSADQNLVINTKYNDGTVGEFLGGASYYMPILKAIDGTDTASYEMGSKFNVIKGEGAYSLLQSSTDTVYVSNADYFGNTSQASASGTSITYVGASGGTANDGTGKGYFFGTCLRATDGTNGTKVNSLVNVYEKPMAPMVIFDICLFGVNTYNAKAPLPADKFLTLTVKKIDETGVITNEVLATSKIYGSDIITDEYNNVYLPFTFTIIDPITGRESPFNLVVKDAFAVVLSGLEQDGCDFGLLCDYKNLIEGKSYFTKIDALTGVSDGKLYSSSTKMNTYMMLNVLYDYLYTEPTTQIQTAPIAGGDAVDASGSVGAVINSFNDFTDVVTGDSLVWIDPATLPAWLTVAYDNSDYAEYGVLYVGFKAEALPSGLGGRSADVLIVSEGAKTTITVNQGTTAVEDVQTQKIQVLNTSESFELDYSSDYKKVSLFSLSGQSVANYDLPSTGKFAIPAGQLSKGIYILKFVGNNTETVKVIR